MFVILISPNFVNFGRFGENQYLRNFPCKVRWRNMILELFEFICER